MPETFIAAHKSHRLDQAGLYMQLILRGARGAPSPYELEEKYLAPNLISALQALISKLTQHPSYANAPLYAGAIL